MVNGWKVTAWIFIILFLIETLLLCWAYNQGVSMVDNKYKCSNEICFNIDSTAFTYDDMTNTCSCYSGDSIIHQEIMK